MKTPHKNILLFFAFAFLFIFNILSNYALAQRTISSNKWSSSDPLSIPIDIRTSEFDKGNIVPNYSFENGINNPEDSTDPYVIDNWEVVGHNVNWVNTESPDFQHNEASDGKHAIKIHREKANELDEHEGILSDFISIIPGNYLFFYDVQIKDVTPFSRSVKLQDTIAVRLIFYDSNKEKISGSALNPHRKNYIDNSNKSFSYANFWDIDDFPWGRVRGRRYNHPFSEGDVPDDAGFVRIFFGLKGKGTIWIDNVELRYSKWNFTTIERMEKYFDRALTAQDRIIPTPKELNILDDFCYFDLKDKKAVKPLILLPHNPTPEEKLAATLLKKHLDTLFNAALSEEIHQKQPIRVVQGDFNLDYSAATELIFNIGRTWLYSEKQSLLPINKIQDKAQGYIIKSLKDKDRLVVFLTGREPVGSYYAATTAIQLLEKDLFIYHDAEVCDFPDFLGRSYLLSPWKNEAGLEHDLQSIARMSSYKFNKAYVGYRQRKGRKDWYRPDNLYINGVKKAARVCQKSGVMNLAVMVNPYYHFDFEMPEEELSDKRYIWTHGDPSSLEMLKNAFRIGLDHGAKTIMLASDDYVPHESGWRKNYAPYTEADKKRFVNLQNAQARVINQLHDWLQANYPGTRFEFCPPWYTNVYIDITPGRAEIYFKELVSQIPDDIAIIWTGPTIRSLSIDMIDLHRYAGLIGRYPMLWNNTLYARGLETRRYGYFACYYPGKVRMCNLFEPLDILLPEDFHMYNDGRHMYTNGSSHSEIYKIKYMTVADYEWNTKAYNPDFSLWKALVTTCGLTNAKNILYFNDCYYGLYDICMRIEKENKNYLYVHRGNEFVTKLNQYYDEIKSSLSGNAMLVNELKRKLERQVDRFHIKLKGFDPIGATSQ